MFKKILFMALIMSQWSLVNSQTISRKSISSAGGTLTGGSYMITFNVGETVIPTLSAGSTILAQGFEQPGEQIQTGIIPAAACIGTTINVPFTATDLLATNIYTAQLSDATGSFASPINIGTLAGNSNAGIISTTIPANTPSGNGYKIRVVGSVPLTIGTPSANITLNPVPHITSITPFAPLCQNGDNGRIFLTVAGGTPPNSYSWAGSNFAATTTTPDIAGLTPGNYSVTLTDVNGCQDFASTFVPFGQPAISAPGTIVINPQQLNANGVAPTSVTGELRITTGCFTATQVTFTDKVYTIRCGVALLPNGLPANINIDQSIAPNAVQVIIRTFTAQNGSSPITYSTVQYIYVRSYKLSDVIVPNDQALQCANSSTDPSVTGSPNVGGGALGQGLANNLSSSYTDARVTNANGFTIKRTWVLKNDCTGETRTVVQNLTYTEGSCPSATFSVSGKIQREDLMDVPAKVSVQNAANELLNSTTNASYSFNNLLINNRYRITPDRPNTDWTNGVTTFDIAMVSRHVLGISALATPYQIIAGDVNRSGEVDATDMLLMQKLILHLNETFPNNNSWRFVAKNYQFQDPTNPFASDFPETLIIPNLTNAVTNGDFVAIKVGDVNGSLGSASIRGGVAPYQLSIEDKILEKGKTYEIPVRMTSSVTALQYAISVDKNAAQIVNIAKGDLPNANDNNFGLFKNEGIVTAAWYQNANQKLGESDSYTMFYLTIKPTTNTRLSQVLSLNPLYTEGVAYDAVGTGAPVKLSFGNTAKVSEGIALFQNHPNPFNDETTISFKLPEDTDARLTITSVDGKLVKEVKGNFKAGLNTIVVQKSELKTSGVFYYRLETADFSATKKMVIME